MTVYAAGDRHQLGLDLNALRTEAGLNLLQISVALRWSNAKTSRMLNGATRGISFTDLRALLILFGTSPAEQERLQALNDRTKNKSDLAVSFPFLNRHEIAYHDALLVAPVVRIHSGGLIPAPLQTLLYSQMVLSWAPIVHAEVGARMRLAAQTNLALRNSTSHVTMIMNEAALWRASRDQLEYLLTFGERYAIHVFPFSAGVCRGLLSSFALLSWPGADSQNLVAEHRIIDQLLIERRVQFFTDALEQFDELLEQCEPAESFSLIVQRHLSAYTPG